MDPLGLTVGYLKCLRSMQEKHRKVIVNLWKPTSRTLQRRYKQDVRIRCKPLEGMLNLNLDYELQEPESQVTKDETGR